MGAEKDLLKLRGPGGAEQVLYFLRRAQEIDDEGKEGNGDGGDDNDQGMDRGIDQLFEPIYDKQAGIGGLRIISVSQGIFPQGQRAIFPQQGKACNQEHTAQVDSSEYPTVKETVPAFGRASNNV